MRKSTDSLVVSVRVRSGGSYDYRYAPGYTKLTVISALRQIADQLESNTDVEHPTSS